jgi:hypothetical protein
MINTFEWAAYKQMKKYMEKYELDINEYIFMKFYIESSIPVDITFENNDIYITIFNNNISLVMDKYKEKLFNLIQIYSDYLFNILLTKDLIKQIETPNLSKVEIKNIILNKFKDYELRNRKSIQDEFCMLLYSLIISNTQKLNKKLEFS